MPVWLSDLLLKILGFALGYLFKMVSKHFRKKAKIGAENKRLLPLVDALDKQVLLTVNMYQSGEVPSAEQIQAFKNASRNLNRDFF